MDMGKGLVGFAIPKLCPTAFEIFIQEDVEGNVDVVGMCFFKKA
jgi:hypothetical protein